MKLRACFVILSLLMAVPFTAYAQTSADTTAAAAQVPRVLTYSGVAKDDSGNPIIGELAITFSLYQNQEGGSPLWVETQKVQTDAEGHYTAQLGSATPGGVPLALFSATEVHWISTRISGQPEAARVLLLSVPYALKAADAETLGGLPASAFLQANPAAAPNSGSATSPAAAATSKAGTNLLFNTVTGLGTANYLPIWRNATSITSSVVYQTGGNVGIGTTTPAAKLDTNGSGTAVSGTSTGATGVGVIGQATSATGATTGVVGLSSSASNGATGVYGQANAATGLVVGVTGVTNSSTLYSSGVSGFAASATGNIFGVNGGTNSTTTFATGVNGYEGATTGQVYGVAGNTNSSTNFAAGVSGYEGATTGTVFGVQGGTNSTTNGAAAVDGSENAASGVVYGVAGYANSSTTNAAGVNGYEGATAGQVYGVNGNTNSTGPFAAAVNGFEGATTGQVWGVSGSTNSTGDGSAGVSGYEGATSGNVIGVSGSTPSTSGTGVNGTATATSGFATGVYGQTSSPSGSGVVGSNNSSGSALLGNGVFGISTATSGAAWGVKGTSNSTGGVGVEGFSIAVGVRGQGLICTNSSCTPEPADAGQFITAAGGNIVHGFVNNAGVWSEMFRVDSSGNGFFAGNLNVTGNVSKGGGSFKIDDPLDPANKYLSHSFVESPDMMNVYNGNVTTDKRGVATVVLPEYFETLNRDFRYQLTVIGRFAQAIVAREIRHNRFTIRTSKPGVKVSWQVTGIRQDAYANAHRIPVEEEKPQEERGHYLHPELFGATEHEAIGAVPAQTVETAGTNRISRR